MSVRHGSARSGWVIGAVLLGVLFAALAWSTWPHSSNAEVTLHLPEGDRAARLHLEYHQSFSPIRGLNSSTWRSFLMPWVRVKLSVAGVHGRLGFSKEFVATDLVFEKDRKTDSYPMRLRDHWFESAQFQFEQHDPAFELMRGAVSKEWQSFQIMNGLRGSTTNTGIIGIWGSVELLRRGPDGQLNVVGAFSGPLRQHGL